MAFLSPNPSRHPTIYCLLRLPRCDLHSLYSPPDLTVFPNAYSSRPKTQTISSWRLHWQVRQRVLRCQHDPRRCPRDLPLVPPSGLCNSISTRVLDPTPYLHCLPTCTLCSE